MAFLKKSGLWCPVFALMLGACVYTPPCPPPESVPEKPSPVIEQVVEPETPKASQLPPKPEPSRDKPVETVAKAEPKDMLESCHVRRPESRAGFLNDGSFVMSWYLVGPFSLATANDGASESMTAIHHSYVQDEKNPLTGNPWRHVTLRSRSGRPGEVDLLNIFGREMDGNALYAVAYISSGRAMDNLVLYVGCDDLIKIWINGRLVHTYSNGGRVGHWDQDRIGGVSLEQGRNTVVVKTVNLHGPWSFYFRLADTDGSPLEFTRESTEVPPLAASAQRP